MLYEQGDIAVPFFVVVSCELEIMRPFGAAETLVTVIGPGQFTGEVNTISDRRSFFRVRASKPGKVIELLTMPYLRHCTIAERSIYNETYTCY